MTAFFSISRLFCFVIIFSITQTFCTESTSKIDPLQVQSQLNDWATRRKLKSPACSYNCAKAGNQIYILCTYQECKTEKEVIGAIVSSGLEITELIRKECPIQKAEVKVTYQGKSATIMLLDCEKLAREKNETGHISRESIVEFARSISERQAIYELFSIPIPIPEHPSNAVIFANEGQHTKLNIDGEVSLSYLLGEGETERKALQRKYKDHDSDMALEDLRNKFMPTIQYKEGSIGSLQYGMYFGITSHGTKVIFENHVRVIQVISESSIIADRGGETILISGLGTKDLVDGSNINTKHLAFMYVGTKTYTSVIGASRTVHHVQLVNVHD